MEDVISDIGERFALDIRMDHRAWILPTAAESRDLAIDGISSKLSSMSRYLS